jgi:hypothetical protein
MRFTKALTMAGLSAVGARRYLYFLTATVLNSPDVIQGKTWLGGLPKTWFLV